MKKSTLAITLILISLLTLLSGCSEKTELLSNQDQLKSLLKTADDQTGFCPSEFYDGPIYDGLDIELTFWHQGDETPCGIWSSPPEFFEDTPNIEVIAGDMYVNYEGSYQVYNWDNFSAQAYGDQSKNIPYMLFNISTTRDDIYTYRGIHVGSTLDEVKEKYRDEMPSEIVENGRIEYQKREYWGSYGPHLYFYIEDNAVTKMELIYSPSKN